MLLAHTALGRNVDVHNWRAHHTDTILRILWDVRQLGGARASASVAQFANATGLELDDVIALCGTLEKRRLVANGLGTRSYRLTPSGATLVSRKLGSGNGA